MWFGEQGDAAGKLWSCHDPRTFIMQPLPVVSPLVCAWCFLTTLSHALEVCRAWPCMFIW